jgi:hypothetical protein
MDAQKMERKMQFTEGLIQQLVEGIEALQNEVADYSIYDKDISASLVGDRLRDLLKVEAPDGKPGTLMSAGGDWMIGGSTRITGEYQISTVPGDFNGWVWNEEMDRPPREEAG